MAEPASTVGIGISVACTTAVACIGTTVSAVLGIDMTTFLYAFAGGFFGQGLDPEKSIPKAIAKFVLSSLISALAATALSKLTHIEEPTVRYLTAVGLAFGFYPITKTLIKVLPNIVVEGIRRAFGLPPIAPRPPSDGGQP